MPQLTLKERAQQISDLVQEANKMPPTEKHPVERIQGIKGAAVNCDVISIAVDHLLLNPNSHRLRAQLVDDPQWIGSPGTPGLKVEPHDDAAQALIASYIRQSEHFSSLTQSLLSDGQAQNGLITHQGVLINGNTRAVALRDLGHPDRRHIRVAVLPQHVDTLELNMLELRLQMQEELKSKYSLTNELLFVEDLHRSHLTDEHINAALRYDLENPKKGAMEVKTRLDSLDFIRFLQKRVGNSVRLTTFDRLGYQQLRETQTKYRDLQNSGQHDEADRFLDNFILAMLAGVTAVHKLRRIDASFMSEYMLTQLEDDEEIGAFSAALVAPRDKASGTLAPGLDKMAGKRRPSSDDPPIDTKKLIDILTKPEKTYNFDQAGIRVSLEQGKITHALGEAIEGGIREKRRDDRTEDKLSAPLESIRDAAKRLQIFVELFREAVTNPNFDKARKQRLLHAFRGLKKRYRDAEALMAKLDD